MVQIMKVECAKCGGGYYVDLSDANLMLPDDIQAVEAFPHQCPFCDEGRYAVVPEEE